MDPSLTQDNAGIGILIFITLSVVFLIYFIFFAFPKKSKKKSQVDLAKERERYIKLCKERGVPWDASQIKVICAPEGLIRAGEREMQRRASIR